MQEKMEPSKESTVPSIDETPLAKHIRFFGGNCPEGVSFSSVSRQNHNTGDNWLAATTNAALVMGAAGFKVKGCPFSMFKPEEAVGVLNHPYSSGVFNLDGTINEEKWQMLLQYAEKNESEEDIISESNLNDFLTRCRAQEKRPDPLRLGLAASKGEWSTFFKKFGLSNSQGERFVTIQRLRDFYEDSQRVGEEITMDARKSM